MRHNKTKPVPAPEGYKWVVSKTMLTGAEFQLGLWLEDAIVDRNGLESVKVGIPGTKRTTNVLMHSRHVAAVYFDKPRQIRRASKRVLREFEREQARRGLESKILGEIS